MTSEFDAEPTEYKTKRIKIIENGMIKFKNVRVTTDDVIAERDEEIKSLKALVDSLRVKIETLEQEKQRYQLRDAPVDEAESYRIYG